MSKKENEYKALLEEMLNWAHNNRNLLFRESIPPEKKVILLQTAFVELEIFKMAFENIKAKEDNNAKTD